MMTSLHLIFAADCEPDSSFGSSGVPENVEATPPDVTRHAPLPSAPAPVAQETPQPQAPPPVTRAPSKAPPLPVLRFPRVSRGRGQGRDRGDMNSHMYEHTFCHVLVTQLSSDYWLLIIRISSSGAGSGVHHLVMSEGAAGVYRWNSVAI